MTRSLRKKLEEEAYSESFLMTIPHPFLPPRYRNISKNRNMLLLLDVDLTLHIRWEGARLHEELTLTPRAARHLIREVLTRMTKYRGDLQVFSKFIESEAEEPFGSERGADLSFSGDEKSLTAPKAEAVGAEVIATINIPQSTGGGDSPLPAWLEEYDEGE